MSKFDMFTGAEIDRTFEVECLLDIVNKVENGYTVSAAQHPMSHLRGFCVNKDRCEIIIAIGAEPVGGTSRVGNLRNWLQSEIKSKPVFIICREGNKEWEELVIGAFVDHAYNRLLLQT